MVVIPAHNEALDIGQVIQSMPEFVDQLIVVDDNSSAASREVALPRKTRV